MDKRDSGFATLLAESLWLSAGAELWGEAVPRRHSRQLKLRVDGKPQAFRKACGKAAGPAVSFSYPLVVLQALRPRGERLCTTALP